MPTLFEQLQQSLQSPTVGLAAGLLRGADPGQSLGSGLSLGTQLQSSITRGNAANNAVVARISEMRQARLFRAQQVAAQQQQQQAIAQASGLLPGQTPGAGIQRAQAMGLQPGSEAFNEAVQPSPVVEVNTGASGDIKPTELLALRKDFNSQVAPLKSIQTGIKSFQNLLANDSGASDFAMLNAFIKSILPNEAIMEGDVARAAGMTGLYDGLKAQLSRLEGGETLTPEGRKQMLQTMQALHDSALGVAKKQLEFSQGEEQFFNVPGRITGGSGVDFEFNPNIGNADPLDAKRERMQFLLNKRDGG